jgi:hypothetical protein
VESVAWLSPKLLLADGDQYSIEFSSVTEYLTDRKRSGRRFSVDVAAEHGKYTIRCLESLFTDDAYVKSIISHFISQRNHRFQLFFVHLCIGALDLFPNKVQAI